MKWIAAGAVALVALLGADVRSGEGAEVFGGANVRASFDGRLSPRALPRRGPAPIALRLRGSLTTRDGRPPPQLRSIEVAVNRFGRISTVGLPRCPANRLRASTTADALRRCGNALIGSGSFAADILIPTQAPFPARGRALIFNGVQSGRHVLLGHVYGTDPIPTSQVLTIRFRRPEGGTFGTRFSIEMPKVAEDWGHVSAFDFELRRRYRFRGRERSVIAASCPAPRGAASALFSAARGTYELADGRSLSRIVTGRCLVRE